MIFFLANEFFLINYYYFLNGAGTDVAGEIVEVGQGVKKFKAGDKVVAFLSNRVSVESFNFCYFPCL